MTLIFDPVILMLFDKSTSRHHPIVYKGSPPPTSTDTALKRWRSAFHHTEGFESLEKAQEYVHATLLPQMSSLDYAIGNIYYNISENSDGIWSGEGVPTATRFFDTESNQLTKYIPEASVKTEEKQ